MHKFAERLKELRHERGLSHEKLSNATGLSRVAISLWERGQREPTLNSLIILAKFFGVTLDEMAGLTD